MKTIEELNVLVENNKALPRNINFNKYNYDANLINLYENMINKNGFKYIKYIPTGHMTAKLASMAHRLDRRITKYLNLLDEEYCIEILEEDSKYKSPLDSNTYVGKYPECDIDSDDYGSDDLDYYYDDIMNHRGDVEGWHMRHKAWLAHKPKNIFKYIPEFTEKITKRAIELFPHNIIYIEQTEEWCILAVQNKLRNYSILEILTENVQIEIMKCTPNYLKFLKNPSEQVKITAIKTGLRTDMYSHLGTKTDKMIWEILKVHPHYYDNFPHCHKLTLHALKYGYKNYARVDHNSPAIQLAIFKKLFNIESLDELSDNICALAIKMDYNLHKFMNNRSRAVVLEMIKTDYKNVQLIEKPDDDFLIECVKLNPMVISILSNPSKQICIEAVKTQASVVKYIRNLEADIVLQAMQQDISIIKEINLDMIDDDDAHKIYLKAVKKNGILLKYIDTDDEEIIKVAITQNGYAIKYVKNQTYELCKMAMDAPIFKNAFNKKYHGANRLYFVNSYDIKKLL